ncbi:glutathione synthetase ATP-binding domain-like protein [Linnemannia elongata AG-77]|uniref:Glutathione synthetase ATP-binding domain-like protein n=1 Tax=Linnemannia elongata AG-77 TaxID=1314771 RepID=A0A197KE59_9FUNG|nr:glutathione synthetase ATP-binding domain-like protein [Linnemannia elongata AG-77]
MKSIEDLRNQLLKADFTDIEIVPVSLRTIVEVSDALAKEMKTYNDRGQELVVFQLCDGTELDGYPGVSMIHELEKRKIPFTGSDSAFYIISSSKPILKRELQKANVPTSSFEEFIDPPKMVDLDNIIREIGFPMIVKPSISYASINISMKSVVHTPDELLKKEQKMELDIETPTVFVEKYLAGREFTALVVGDKDWGVRVYPVAERAFDPKLGKFERLLAFDQYWDGYNLEGGSGNEEFCKYQMANGAWQDHLQQVAKDAYLALDGNGYGRVDIRTVEMDTCEPVVLEVNANCGLSFEKDSSSMANILLMTKVSPPGFVRDLIDSAIHRNNRLNHPAAHKLLTPHRSVVTAVHASTVRHAHEVLVKS